MSKIYAVRLKRAILGPMTDATPTPEAAEQPAVKKKEVAPFVLREFLTGDLAPRLERELKAQGCADLKIAVAPDSVSAHWDLSHNNYRFTLTFEEDSLDGRKTLTWSQRGKGAVTQMFMPPERGFKNAGSDVIVFLLIQKFSSTMSWIHKKG